MSIFIYSIVTNRAIELLLLCVHVVIGYSMYIILIIMCHPHFCKQNDCKLLLLPLSSSSLFFELLPVSGLFGKAGDLSHFKTNNNGKKIQLIAFWRSTGKFSSKFHHFQLLLHKFSIFIYHHMDFSFHYMKTKEKH